GRIYRPRSRRKREFARGCAGHRRSLDYDGGWAFHRDPRRDCLQPLFAQYKGAGRANGWLHDGSLLARREAIPRSSGVIRRGVREFAEIFAARKTQRDTEKRKTIFCEA